MITVTIQKDGVPFADITATPINGTRVDDYLVKVWTKVGTPDVDCRSLIVDRHDRADGVWALVMNVVGGAAAPELEDEA